MNSSIKAKEKDIIFLKSVQKCCIDIFVNFVWKYFIVSIKHFRKKYNWKSNITTHFLN